MTDQPGVVVPREVLAELEEAANGFAVYLHAQCPHERNGERYARIGKALEYARALLSAPVVEEKKDK